MAPDRRTQESVILAVISLSALLAIAAAILANTPGYYGAGMLVGAAGLVATVLGIHLGRGLDALTPATAPPRYVRRELSRYWSPLKSSSVLLNLLALFSITVIVAGVFTRPAGLAATPSTAILRIATALVAILAVDMAAAHFFSLKSPPERISTGLEGPFLAIGEGLTLLLAGAALAAAGFAGPLGAVLPLTGADAPIVLLAGYIVAALSLFVSRSLPTLYSIFTERRVGYGATTGLARASAVTFPAVTAFALLFLVVLLLLVFGVGVVAILEEIPRNTVLLAVFGSVILVLLVSVVASFRLAKAAATPLYRLRTEAETGTGLLLLGSSGLVGGILLAVGALLYAGIAILGIPTGRWLDFLTFAILVFVGPYGFYAASRRGRIRKLEERFPDFLRDLAASRKAGLTLPAAVKIASKGEYGALTPEIQRLADQLSWNVAFDEALARFGERAKTPLIQRAVALVLEASRTGGNVTDVLLAAARDAREIKNLENERGTSMLLYTAIIYIAFLVFLGIAATLYGTFVPEIAKASAPTIGGTSPGLAGLSVGAIRVDEYRTFYFIATLVQALGNGVVAGIMESGRATMGLRHSFVMVLITYVTFAVILV